MDTKATQQFWIHSHLIRPELMKVGKTCQRRHIAFAFYEHLDCICRCGTRTIVAAATPSPASACSSPGNKFSRKLGLHHFFLHFTMLTFFCPKLWNQTENFLIFAQIKIQRLHIDISFWACLKLGTSEWGSWPGTPRTSPSLLRW